MQGHMAYSLLKNLNVLQFFTSFSVVLQVFQAFCKEFQHMLCFDAVVVLPMFRNTWVALGTPMFLLSSLVGSKKPDYSRTLFLFSADRP